MEADQTLKVNIRLNRGEQAKDPLPQTEASVGEVGGSKPVSPQPQALSGLNSDVAQSNKGRLFDSHEGTLPPDTSAASEDDQRSSDPEESDEEIVVVESDSCTFVLPPFTFPDKWQKIILPDGEVAWQFIVLHE